MQASNPWDALADLIIEARHNYADARKPLPYSRFNSPFADHTSAAIALESAVATGATARAAERLRQPHRGVLSTSERLLRHWREGRCTDLDLEMIHLFACAATLNLEMPSPAPASTPAES